jgi:uncharacterized protein (TIRG00374 family)
MPDSTVPDLPEPSPDNEISPEPDLSAAPAASAMTNSTDLPQTVEAAATSSPPAWQVVLKVIFSAALIYLIIRLVDLREVGQVFRQADWLLVGGGFVLFAISQGLRALRWHLLIAAHAPTITLPTTLNALFVGLFFNMVLPAEVGGDVVRGLWIDKAVGSRSATFASVLVDRIMGMLSMALMALVALGAGAGQMGGATTLMVVVVAGALLLFTAAISSQRVADFFIRLPCLPRRFDLATRLERFSAAVRLYRCCGTVIVKVVAWSFIFQFAVYLSYYLLARGLGMSCPLWSFFAFIPLITLITMFPASLNGIGAREAGYVFFFREVGLGTAQATSLSLASYAFLVAVSLLGGLIYLLNRRSA